NQRGEVLSTSYETITKGTVWVYDTTTGKQLLAFLTHTGSGVHSLAFSPDGQRLVTLGGWSSLKVWEADSGKEAFTLAENMGWGDNVAYSPDGKWIACAHNALGVKANPGKVHVWDAVTGKEAFTLPEGSRAIRSVAFSPNGRYLASGDEGG